MTHATLETTVSTLTPAQSADVIRYYDAVANEAAYRNGWKPKIALGHVAIRTTQSRYSMLPNGEPMLTAQEMTDGLEYLQNGQPKVLEQHNAWPAEPMYEQLQRIEELVDKVPCSYDDAYAMVMGIRAH